MATVTVTANPAPTVTISANPDRGRGRQFFNAHCTATNATQVTINGSDGSSYTFRPRVEPKR